MTIVLFGSVLSVTFALVILGLLRRLSGNPARIAPNAARSAVRIEDRYRPMARLLASPDAKFLKRQDGFSSEMSREFRARRRKLFRSYVRCLARDFTRLYNTLELAIVESRQDRSDLVRLMLQQKARFVMAMFAIELRLAIHAWGVNGMDVQRLVQSVSALKGAWSLLSVPQEPAATNG
jgi:hypothetical protein